MGTISQWRALFNSWWLKPAAPSTLGQLGELQAARYLRQKGLRLVQRNYRSPWGEIDLIMRDRHCIVFVEVRYRKPSSYASAVESIDKSKQNRLIKTAQHYLKQHHGHNEQRCRFDVVAITPHRDKVHIDWITNAIEQ